MNDEELLKKIDAELKQRTVKCSHLDGSKQIWAEARISLGEFDLEVCQLCYEAIEAMAVKSFIRSIIREPIARGLRGMNK